MNPVRNLATRLHIIPKAQPETPDNPLVAAVDSINAQNGTGDQAPTDDGGPIPQFLRRDTPLQLREQSDAVVAEAAATNSTGLDEPAAESDEVIDMLEHDIVTLVGVEVIASADDQNLIIKHQATTERMINYLVARDGTLTKAILQLIEARRQTRVVLAGYRNANGTIAAGSEPTRKRRRKAKPDSAAARAAE